MNKRKGSDSMTNTIEEIIAYNNSIEKDFINYQKKRLKELKSMRARQKRGEDVDISEIIDNLKKIGILNEDGTLSSRYKLEE